MTRSSEPIGANRHGCGAGIEGWAATVVAPRCPEFLIVQLAATLPCPVDCQSVRPADGLV